MRTPAGEVSKRLKAKAIKVLAATIDSPEAALYLPVMSARTLLQQQKSEPKPAEDDDEFPIGNGGRVVILRPGEKYDAALHNPDGKVGIVLPAKVVILPSNGRENIAQERERDRLAALAELPIADDVDEPESMPEVPAPQPPGKLTGRERLRRLRAKRRAAREVAAIWS